jgi:two-component system cell cycle response regulator DivK
MKRVLLAEDNEANRELLREILESRGFEVSEACDGDDALLKATEVKPDLILLDIQMPQRDGLRTLQALRAGDFPHTPVLALTAFAMRGDRERLVDSGFDGYVSKPIQINLLLAEIGRHLS